MPAKLSAETKSVIADIANKVANLFTPELFRNIIDRFVTRKYEEGINDIEAQFGFNVTFGGADRDLAVLKEYVADNIKGVTDDMQDKLRQELQRGIMNSDTNLQLRKRISDIFRGSNPTRFNYEDRIKMIARTEGKRASNMAKYESMAKLNRPNIYKYIKIILDGRTSDICIEEDIKYGAKEQAIPMMEDFIVTSKGQTYRAKYPPFHVNCRSTVVFTQK